MTPESPARRCAETVADAEELQTILANAGIDSSSRRPSCTTREGTDDVPTKVLVDESQLEAALDAIEALTEPDELTGD